MSHLLNLADDFPRTATQAVGGIMPEGTTSYRDADGSYNAAVTLPTAIDRRNEILTIAHNATLDTVLQGSNKSPSTALTLSAANRITRWISDGVTWRAVEDSKAGGNILAKVANVAPIAVLPVGDLFEVSMPANTDVRIRALVNRQVYITSEGEYPGGSFTTSTAAIVNLTPTFVPADNNVHVNGELNVIRIQDILSGRLFVVTVWRLGAIAGNWSGWVEEIGVSYQAPAQPPADFFRTLTGATLPDGVNDLTESITRSGLVFAKGFKAESGLPVGGAGPSDQVGFYFGGAEGDGGMHSFPNVDSAIGFSVDAKSRMILRNNGSIDSGHWSLNAGEIGAAQSINAHHYVGTPSGARIAHQINLDTAGSSVFQEDGISILFNNNSKVNTSGIVGCIAASDLSSPFGVLGTGAKIEFLRKGSAANNHLGITLSTRANEGLKPRIVIDSKGQATLDCDSDVSGTFFSVKKGTVPIITANQTSLTIQLNTAVAWTVASDERYKNDLMPIDKIKAKSVVMGIHPTSWQWSQKALTSAGLRGQSLGFVAQQVQEFAPEVVSEINKEGYLGISESKMIPYLWAQVQSLTELVDRLISSQAAPVTTVSAPLSVNLTKVDRLLKMDATGLGAIGFTPNQAKTFVAGSNAVKLAISSGMPEAEILKTLSALLTSVGLTLTGVMGQL